MLKFVKITSLQKYESPLQFEQKEVLAMHETCVFNLLGLQIDMKV